MRALVALLIAVALALAGCLPARQVAMPDMSDLEPVGFVPATCGSGPVVLVGYRDERGKPGWNAVYLAEDVAGKVPGPVVLVDFDPDTTPRAAYVDVDADGVVDERYTRLDDYYARYGRSMCEAAGKIREARKGTQ